MIVVGITGGIAAYKAVGVVRGLVLAGHDVHVIATESALRFVGRPTLEAISRNTVHTDLFEGVAEVRHVALGQRADLILIAPATAHTLASLAGGLAGDLLGTTVLASAAPVLLAPAMHTEMWDHSATQANVATLRARGLAFVGPATGQLTGTDSGAGRMSEPEEIVARALDLLRPQDLEGRRVLISAGGTREPLDPVRYLGNRSSGRQGVALAEAARSRGAAVTLVAAHLEVPAPAGVVVERVGTARELEASLRAHAASHDTIIMAAAVADFRPRAVAEEKIKKDASEGGLSLELERTPDIIAGLSEHRAPGQRIVGFAAETASDEDALLALGAAKARRKGVDLLVLNRVGWAEGFGTEDSAVIVLDATGVELARVAGDKLSVAHRILDVIP
ncbi:MAG: bifunctional phosphopantothenoylcysteine decarboxylase/phosphopantothenate--cysteine ligase CoaBC [Actinobacteria bacterium]|nr:bifunctional phosphopantothenoylcysteine decarboxylase/phosphopantothenate--cysteine ligase CoaBC [Actinomycetota bacterium]MBU1609708.1 bifunctional phosphopantothenoylcysteine decarboxylase/phosphopantothenate--cysteine ligase CoaBC [Actinomycetota bacterium]MBU2316213.1 bifunctional phosphopantothenoylcysteine decarboxylase/phosphopantothenate--cysteine ligase CoaBC [Actinomycetota bacterium]MBU2385689.1 bifunctional phosphopantothenoylcysteine decarboxylase/phosphopantothenate--cysteine l